MLRRSVLGLALVTLPLLACTAAHPVVDGGAEGGPTSVLGFTPSNIASALVGVDTSKLVDIDVTASPGKIEVECASQATGACVTATVTQSDGTQVDVFFARSWRIEANSMVTAGDAKPIAIVALTTIDVLGRIDASAQNITATAGGFAGTTGPGGGKGGGAQGSSANVAPGVGGGGGAFCGAGGAGGNATPSNGAGGVPYGNPQLIPLAVGSAGGAGATFGGASGGAMQLVAGTSIDVEAGGVVSVGGGGGDPGGSSAGGGGGGSGGGLLLEAPSVTIAGTLEANGGGGGGGSSGSQYGADATPNGQPASGGSPSTTGAGGSGGAGASPGGVAGAAGDPAPGTNMAGGGGGGTGYIRINTKTGVGTISGTVSPAVTTACATQGTVAS